MLLELFQVGGKCSIGTFAHPDIAFKFASWLNTEFKLYMITEFESLKKNESYQNKLVSKKKNSKNQLYIQIV